MKRARSVLCLLVGVVGMIPLSSGAAAAAERSPGGEKVAAEFQTTATQTFRNRATGKCVEGTNIAYSNTCTYDWEQEWYVHRWADGTRQLKNVYSGLCLTGQDDGWGMGSCNSSTDQSWFVRSFSNGIELRNQRNGKCLDDSAQHGLRTYPCSTTPQPYQLWY